MSDRTKLCLLALLLSFISQQSLCFLFPGSKNTIQASLSRSTSLHISRRSRFGVLCLHSENLSTNTFERPNEDVHNQGNGCGNLKKISCNNLQHENAGNSIEPHALDVITRDKHRVRVWYKSPESAAVDSPRVFLLLHGRTWSSIPV